MSAPAYAPTATLPRLLHGVPSAGAMSLPEHAAIHGELSAHLPSSGRSAAALIAEVELAGLSGRGGGGFPTAVKMRAVLDARGSGRGMSPRAARPMVVVNAAEGEPGSLKDQTLLEALPHLVLDGAETAAAAVSADEVIVCICEQADAAHASVTQAIRERHRRTDDGIRWHVAAVPARYIAGQESALVSFLSGGKARPTFTPPMPFERGVRQRPTLVNNPETFAHLALIARHGARWFRGLGTSSQPGSTLVTLGGPVTYPGVYEIEHGSPLSSLIEAAGGTTEEVRAALIGGYAGTWVGGDHLSSLVLSDEHLAPYGASLGTGVVILLGADSCGLAETARVARWLAQESAGQCGPCKHGLDALATTLEGALEGVSDLPDPDHRRRLAHLMSIVRGRGACSHPDGTVRFLSSALQVFADELADHMQYGNCSACSRPATLPLPADRPPRMAGSGRVHVTTRPRGRSRRTSAPNHGHARLPTGGSAKERA
jgi:NADH:ubiquinone oxidoreductase subunit F (NADH-binding)